LTPNDLIEFEKEIGILYENKEIHAPIHLRNGNEQQLVEIFQEVCDRDWVFSTWASHLHALLKGVPKKEVKKEILAGHSITLMFPDYNFYTSAIVGGICPIAVGVAWALREQKSSSHVWVFIGDMASFTGITQESMLYAEKWDLPVTFVIEDNGKSVGTPTRAVWNADCKRFTTNDKVRHYSYDLQYPHSGIGKFIEF
jgi:pyruvate dehydrogenase E1 component alpha subunit